MTAPSMPSALCLPYGEAEPQVGEDVWLAPGVVLVGEVVIHARATVLFNAVLRGDINRVEVGEGSNRCV